MSGPINIETINQIRDRIRLCDYLAVAQLYLRDNFLLDKPLTADHIKPRLLGHWGTCHGINVAYANFENFFSGQDFTFIVGPGHGFPAIQANLFLDGELAKVDDKATFDEAGLAYICRNFSWPDGFPSHASPNTPGIITEGGELGYALANAYGLGLGHPEKTIAVLIGDGELETATALDSLNLHSLLGGDQNPHSSGNTNNSENTLSNKNTQGCQNARILPILHLNGYKISAPTIYARKSERELNEMLRGFGFTPIKLDGENTEKIQQILAEDTPNPFYILCTEKGFGGPNRHHQAHQIPLKNPTSDPAELTELENWLKSYNAPELFAKFKKAVE